MKVILFLMFVFFSCTSSASSLEESLRVAAMDGNTFALGELVKRGADINSKGSEDRTGIFKGTGPTALILAVLNGHYEAVKLLVKLGADLEVANFHGETALYIAIGKNDNKTSRFLISKGANINSVTNNGSNVFLTAVANNPNIALELVNKVSDVEARDSKIGYSTLHYAVVLGDIYLAGEHPTCIEDDDKVDIELLVTLLKKIINKTRNLSIEDNYGHTPLDWATACNSSKSIELLKYISH